MHNLLFSNYPKFVIKYLIRLGCQIIADRYGPNSSCKIIYNKDDWRLWSWNESTTYGQNHCKHISLKKYIHQICIYIYIYLY